MASSLETLLSLDPLQALVRMLNDANGTNYRLDLFTASLPTVSAGTSTQVTLTGMAPANSFDDNSVNGAFTVTYERLEMASFLQGILAGYHPTLPLSTQNVLDEITSLIGQKFYIDDVVLEEVTRDNGALYRLKAKAESLRFVGYIDLPLIALTDISTVLASAINLAPPTQQVLYSPQVALPFLNATDWRSIAEEFTIGDLAQNKIDLVTLVNGTVPHPASADDLAMRPWYADSTAPGAFNLYNAKVVSYGSGLGVNAAIPTLESAITISLDGNWCTNFLSGDLTIPYTNQNFNLDGYTDVPRLNGVGVVSLSDGSPWNVYLNSLAVNSTIYSLANGMTLDRALDNGTVTWIATQGLPKPTNLSGAQVLYNGQVRPTDIPAATQGADRVLALYLGPDNSMFQGEYHIYYSSPIKWTVQTLQGTVGSAYYYDFSTEMGGSAGFTYVIAGALPAGITLTGSVLSGTFAANTEGTYFFTLSVTRTSDNTTVVFQVTMKVSAVVAPLAISGSLPAGVMGQDYVQFLDVTGGLAPYTDVSVIPGNLPATSIQNNTVRVTAIWPSPDIYRFTIQVKSADGQTASMSYSVNVTSSFAPLALSGTLNNAVAGIAYSSSLTISGGSGTYNTPTLVNGVMPPGLTFSISTVGTPKVVLSGTPTEGGIYQWTSQLTDSQNDTLQFTTTVSITTLNYSATVMADNPVGYWPCNETSGTVMADISGYGNAGTYVGGTPGTGPGLRFGATTSLQTTGTSSYGARAPLGTLKLPSGSALSLEAVIQKTTDHGNLLDAIISSFLTGSAQVGFFFFHSGTDSLYAYNFSYGNNYTQSGTVPSGSPNHLVYTCDGQGHTALYVNGVAVATGNIGVPIYQPGTYWDFMGTELYPSSYALSGYGSDFAVYDYALSAAQVKNHAQQANLYTGP